MKRPIFLALDTPVLKKALFLADIALDHGVGVKVGLELFLSQGKTALKYLEKRNIPIFLDVKLYDIPTTVSKAVTVLGALPIQYITVHASGGAKMLEAAQKALPNHLSLLAVTCLTSFDLSTLHDIGIEHPPLEWVLRLAKIAMAAGCDGLVCSAEELMILRKHFGQKPLLVVPGIRLEGGAIHDQHRVATPKQALAWGANYLVIGRLVTHADAPAKALEHIIMEMGCAI
jgi:orotidine-5'-phosphate decarboxylase